MLAGASKLAPLPRPLIFPRFWSVLPQHSTLARDLNHTPHFVWVQTFCLISSCRRSSSQQLADAKLQHAKEMKAKATAYADSASPIKKPSSPASSFSQAHTHHSHASPAKSSAIIEQRSVAGEGCDFEMVCARCCVQLRRDTVYDRLKQPHCVTHNRHQVQPAFPQYLHTMRTVMQQSSQALLESQMKCTPTAVAESWRSAAFWDPRNRIAWLRKRFRLTLRTRWLLCELMLTRPSAHS